MKDHPTPPANVDRTTAGRPKSILGIDPGLQRTGYAFLTAESTRDSDIRVIDAGVVRLSRAAPLENRLLELEQGLTELVEANRPITMAVEELYAHYKHPRTAILMGHARGVILALAARYGIPVVSIAATQVKKLLTGSGHASKAQIQRAITVTLNLAQLPEPNDVADALAIALCGLRLRQAELREDAALATGGAG